MRHMIILPLRSWATCLVLMTVSMVALSAVLAGAAGAAPFGITHFSSELTKSTRISEVPVGSKNMEIVNEPYVPAFTQAGGHPWALTTTVDFATEEYELSYGASLRPVVVPTRDPKDIVVDLPPGLLGDPLALPSCPLAVAVNEGTCPSSTQVGFYRLHWQGGKELLAPIVNVTPEPGQSAEFVLENTAKISVVLTGHLVRTAQGYGLTVVSSGIPTVELYGVETTFWGVPADPSHTPMRGLFCASTSLHGKVECGEGAGGGQPSGVAPVPFLTLSTDCAAGPEVTGVRADSWEEPGRVGFNQEYEGFAQASSRMPAVTGCGVLRFDPAVAVEPDTLLADEPVGLGVDLKVPLVETAETDATPQVDNSVLTFPEGVSISPGIVDGIQACNEFGPEGIDITGPESEDVGLDGELQLAPGHCPDASTVGTAEAVIPLLGEPVKGHVYLAKPGCGGQGQAPCTEADALDGNLYKLYLELGGTGELAKTGVHYKVAFETQANPATGQLTAKVLGTPQTPFSDLKVDLNGGPRAALDNPVVCGPATTTTDFTPWSAPGVTPEGLLTAGTPDATPASYYNVEGCSNPSTFSPGFVAGTVTPQAGAYSDFTMNLSRRDREQFIKGIQVHTPPGLSGMLSNVPLCEEPLADSGHCPESSKIGTTRVASGAGSHPFEIEGNVYLTKGYGGAPFGLSIVTNAVAGPFNLGLVVVRARIDVNPENSTLTITTDETGRYAIPQILDGVPLRLQRVTVDIDRPDFMFNPTNCGAPGASGTQQVTAVVSGSQNATADVASAFAVGGCKSLEFKPRFVVSTSGKTSRADGASLDAKVTYPVTAPGTEANIKSVKVELPQQLPSRLTTLRKACTAATFEANPAACPAPSVIGTVRVATPLLPVQLTGPVYFVSHGGEAFPSLVVVLQGDGVRVDVTAATFISKAGITSSTFKSVPDVPFSSFELYLPEGPYSALAANGNLCDLTATIATKRNVTTKAHGRTVHKTITTHTTKPASLVMPTEFVAQNETVIKQNTKIEVTGCATTKNTKAKTNASMQARTSRAHRHTARANRRTAR
jgi:hypothetical protein